MTDPACRPRAALQRLAPLFGAVLAACGGGGSSPPPPPPPPAAVLEGTAAVGAALANADVSVTDSAGAAVCQQATLVTSGTGTFSCTLQSGKSAPFVVVVTDPSGAHPPQVSLATTTPTPGTPLVVNATPLTTAIVAQMAGGDALAVTSTPALIDAARLDAVKAKVLEQLADVLAAIGTPAGYDPFATPIVAATANSGGNTADQVVDLLKISNVGGVITVSTIDNPAGGVPLADADTPTPPRLPAPDAAVTTLAEAVRLVAPALNGCFAVPAAQRVLQAQDRPAAEGGPEVTAVVEACEDIVHPDYLNSGYSAGQAFYGLLHDAAMNGAVFSAPEIMLYLPDTAPGTADRAVVNLRYVDANGVAGNIITVAQRFAGSMAQSGRATDWYLYGNQQVVDSTVRPFIRRNEQFAPNGGISGLFANATNSRFESGIEIFINKDGPGSTGLRAARVTGPGLPPAGLVYTRPDASICTQQTWLNIRRKDGNTDPAAATPAADIGNIFRLQRSLGLTGDDARTVRPNPNAGNTNSTAFMAWAHPLDYGAAPGSTDYIDFGALRANTVYQFEYYYEGETAPRHVYSKTLLQPVVPAVNAGSLRWVGLSTPTLGYLDPAGPLAAATASITLGWTVDPFAEPIRSGGIYTFGPGGSVNQGLVAVARGATSAVGDAPGAAAGCAAGTEFPALTADATSGRALQLRYRMLDGSYKDALWRFN
ncbi:MAG: hypothetical protein KF788_00215 [Piscinibacter sp.]|nr:hypothetical protein [Piscinibacter sp.]